MEMRLRALPFCFSSWASICMSTCLLRFLFLYNSWLNSQRISAVSPPFPTQQVCGRGVPAVRAAARLVLRPSTSIPDRSCIGVLGLAEQRRVAELPS